VYKTIGFHAGIFWTLELHCQIEQLKAQSLEIRLAMFIKGLIN